MFTSNMMQDPQPYNSLSIVPSDLSDPYKPVVLRLELGTGGGSLEMVVVELLMAMVLPLTVVVLASSSRMTKNSQALTVQVTQLRWHALNSLESGWNYPPSYQHSHWLHLLNIHSLCPQSLFQHCSIGSFLNKKKDNIF
jgi:hypothetical protein